MLANDSSRRGFTLVELLVSVAIITVLMAVLIPALASARRISKSVSCLANVRGISLAIREYAQSNDDYLPRCSVFGDVGVQTSATAGSRYAVKNMWPLHWSALLIPYLTGTDLVSTTTTSAGLTAQAKARAFYIKVYTCPAKDFLSYTTGQNDSSTAYLGLTTQAPNDPSYSTNNTSDTNPDQVFAAKLSYMVSTPVPNYTPSGFTIGGSAVNAAAMPYTYSNAFGPVCTIPNTTGTPITFATQTCGLDSGSTFKLSNVASDTLMLNDSSNSDGWGNNGEGSVACFQSQADVPSKERVHHQESLGLSFHGGQNVSMAFFDGHAELYTPNMIFADGGRDGKSARGFAVGVNGGLSGANFITTQGNGFVGDIFIRRNYSGGSAYVGTGSSTSNRGSLGHWTPFEND